MVLIILDLFPRMIEKLTMQDDVLTLPSQTDQLSVCEKLCVCSCNYGAVLVLGIKSRSSCMPGEYSTTELHLQISSCMCTRMCVCSGFMCVQVYSRT